LLLVHVETTVFFVNIKKKIEEENQLSLIDYFAIFLKSLSDVQTFSARRVSRDPFNTIT